MGGEENIRYRNTNVPQQPAPYFQPNPYYHQVPPPVMRQGYNDGYYYPPNSRYYSNPYALPPRGGYPYYDADQYYVPPNSYGTSDIDNPSGAFEKF